MNTTMQYTESPTNAPSIAIESNNDDNDGSEENESKGNEIYHMHYFFVYFLGLVCSFSYSV